MIAEERMIVGISDQPAETVVWSSGSEVIVKVAGFRGLCHTNNPQPFTFDFCLQRKSTLILG